jgi:hypothetical protein
MASTEPPISSGGGGGGGDEAAAVAAVVPHDDDDDDMTSDSDNDEPHLVLSDVDDTDDDDDDDDEGTAAEQPATTAAVVLAEDDAAAPAKPEAAKAASSATAAAAASASAATTTTTTTTTPVAGVSPTLAAVAEALLRAKKQQQAAELASLREQQQQQSEEKQAATRALRDKIRARPVKDDLVKAKIIQVEDSIASLPSLGMLANSISSSNAQAEREQEIVALRGVMRRQHQSSIDYKIRDLDAIFKPKTTKQPSGANAALYGSPPPPPPGSGETPTASAASTPAATATTTKTKTATKATRRKPAAAKLFATPGPPPGTPPAEEKQISAALIAATKKATTETTIKTSGGKPRRKRRSLINASTGKPRESYIHTLFNKFARKALPPGQSFSMISKLTKTLGKKDFLAFMSSYKVYPGLVSKEQVFQIFRDLDSTANVKAKGGVATNLHDNRMKLNYHQFRGFLVSLVDMLGGSDTALQHVSDSGLETKNIRQLSKMFKEVNHAQKLEAEAKQRQTQLDQKATKKAVAATSRWKQIALRAVRANKSPETATTSAATTANVEEKKQNAGSDASSCNAQALARGGVTDASAVPAAIVLSIGCRNLIRTDWMTSTNPLIACLAREPHTDKWHVVGRTEWKKNEYNPDFKKKVAFSLEQRRVEQLFELPSQSLVSEAMASPTKQQQDDESSSSSSVTDVCIRFVVYDASHMSDDADEHVMGWADTILSRLLQRQSTSLSVINDINEGYNR